MDQPVSLQKKAIRKECRVLRQALGENTCQLASQAICDHITKWDVFHYSKIILAYMPIKAEVDLQKIMRDHREKTWVLPRIVPGDDRQMQFHPYIPERMVTHAFGMAEPAPDLPVIAPIDVELALVPGLAFDQHGWRLGYGGGYYDRFLREFQGISAGIVYSKLLFESLPINENDVAMDWIITEIGLLRARSSN